MKFTCAILLQYLVVEKLNFKQWKVSRNTYGKFEAKFYDYTSHQNVNLFLYVQIHTSIIHSYVKFVRFIVVLEM
jgi:hypothetical protein